MKQFTYTKDNGEVSQRKVIVIAEPRKTLLAWDVKGLTDAQITWLEDIQASIKDLTEYLTKEYDDTWDKPISSMWRSFKPESISNDSN